MCSPRNVSNAGKRGFVPIKPPASSDPDFCGLCGFLGSDPAHAKTGRHGQLAGHASHYTKWCERKKVSAVNCPADTLKTYFVENFAAVPTGDEITIPGRQSENRFLSSFLIHSRVLIPGLDALDPEYSLYAVGRVHDPIFNTSVNQTNSFINLVGNLKKMKRNNEALGVQNKPQPSVRRFCSSLKIMA